MDIQKMFNAEIADKKRTASGVHSRKGKRGYVGKMMYPTDLMTRKEKYNYRKGGKVTVTKLYQELISYEEFNALTKEEQQNHLGSYRKNFSNKEITNHWNLNNVQYYAIVSDLELPKAKRTYNKKVKTEVVTAVPVMAEVMKRKATDFMDGFQFQLNGMYLPDVLVSRLEKLSLMVSDEPGKFEVHISIKELK